MNAKPWMLSILSMLMTTGGYGQGNWILKNPDHHPSARTDHAMAALEANKALLFGGFVDGQKFFDTWVYDENTEDWSLVTGSTERPSPRALHAMAQIEDKKVLLFGGIEGQFSDFYSDQTWLFDGTSGQWSMLSPAQKPSPRIVGAMASLGGGKVLLFGGVSSIPNPSPPPSTLTVFHTDTWIFDLNSNTWTEITPAGGVKPPVTSGFTMGAIGDGEVMLFGGVSSGVKRDETWVYHAATEQWSQINPVDKPSARSNHAAAPIADGRVLLFGGDIEVGGIGARSRETWVYHAASEQWSQIDPVDKPTARAVHAMASLGNSKVLLFGGATTDAGREQTWVFDALAECTGPTAVCPENDRTFYVLRDRCYVQPMFGHPQVIANNCPSISTHGCWYFDGGQIKEATGISASFDVGTWAVFCDAYSVGHPEIPPDTCWFTVTVLDTVRPYIGFHRPEPRDTTIELDRNQCATTRPVEYTVPGFVDNCSIVDFVCDPPTNSFFPAGVTRVTCTATDPSGNIGSASFNIIVRPYDPPEITCPPDTAIECGSSEDPDDLGRATATASCGIDVEITYRDFPRLSTGMPGPCRRIIEIRREWKATDAGGNVSTCDQRIFIHDTTPPRITCPKDTLLAAQTPQVVDYNASATESCTRVENLTCNPSSGSTFPVGVTTVTCTARDCDNNESSCSFTVAVAVPVPIDVKPGSCPNPLTTLDRGVVSVAVVGTNAFNPTQIHPSTVRLEGLAPVHWAIEDATSPHTPYLGKTNCNDCIKGKKDRMMDMVFKFDAQALVNALRPITNGECRVVRLVGQLTDGSAFVGEDLMRMQGSLGRVGETEENPVSTQANEIPVRFGLEQCYPNPFNPTTQIRYSVLEPVHVRLVVYDVLGKTVKVLVDREQMAGYHTVEWNATNEADAPLSSGVYFYQLKAGTFTDIKKMLLTR
jgi:N-acetylneuraminic acid mutarotase